MSPEETQCGNVCASHLSPFDDKICSGNWGLDDERFRMWWRYIFTITVLNTEPTSN